ncbi:hypothetical protein B0H13DRAFT_2522369 [Mycena leptocephala]|nr:hypothetical protein B0H13DRAFT_2522369 [Mycena leptocephala]
MSIMKSSYPPLPPLPEVNAVWPDYTIHIEEKTGRRRTYKEPVERVCWGATTLGANVSDGRLALSGDGHEMIGLLGNNSLASLSHSEFTDIVLSLITVTTPFALISTYSTQFELVHALKLTKATRSFVDANLLKDVQADPGVVKGRNCRSFTQMIDSVKRRKVPLEPVRPAKKDTLAYLVMSSGTTVMITHRNIICANYQMIIVNQFAAPYAAPRPEGSVPITIVVCPMLHAYGLHAYRATDLGLIPSAIHQLVNHPAIKTADFTCVHSITSGAAYLPPELEGQMTQFLNEGTGIHQGYGLSEATLAALARPFEGMLNMGPPPPNTMGILLPGLDGRIVRDNGTSAAPGEPGELWLRGGNITAGYWNNPQANANAFVDGWLRTGDQFRADEKGYFC